MIEKSVGLVRNLFKKREQLIALVKQFAIADDAIVILHKDNQFSVNGHSSSDAMTVYMLGTATGMSYLSAKEVDPTLTVEDYLYQPTSVALKHIERNTPE